MNPLRYKSEGKENAGGIVYRLLEVNFGPETYVELVKWNTVYINKIEVDGVETEVLSNIRQTIVILRSSQEFP